MTDYTTIYFDSKTWEIIIFFSKSIAVGILLVGIIYLLEKYIFGQNKENSKEDLAIYISKSILYIFLIFILSIIFGYQYLYLGILFVILLFLLYFYSIPLGVDKIWTWYLKKNYKLHLEMFAIRKNKEEKWGIIKRNLINQITDKHNNILAKKVKPKICIIERSKDERDKDELLLLFIEIWIDKNETATIELNFIEHLISQETEVLSSKNYQKHKFHVEQKQ